MVGNAQKAEHKSIGNRKTFRLFAKAAGKWEVARFRCVHEVERRAVVLAVFRWRLAEAEMFHLGEYQFGASSPSFCCSSMK